MKKATINIAIKSKIQANQKLNITTNQFCLNNNISS